MQALLATDVEKVKGGLRDGYSFGDRISLSYPDDFDLPVWVIPYCLRFCLVPEDFNREMRDKVQKAQERNERIINMIRRRTDIDIDGYVLDASRCSYHYGKALGDVLDEEFGHENLDYLYAHNRKIDIDLFAAVEMYDFTAVEKLLEQGASDDVWLYNGEEGELPADVDSEEYEDFMNDYACVCGSSTYGVESHACTEFIDIPTKKRVVKDERSAVHTLYRWYGALKMIRILENH